MHDPDLLRKVAEPFLPQLLLRRAHLVAHLQEALTPKPQPGGNCARRRLILCCAPAGYGKTTLLADFARSTSFPCCWYFLNKEDSDPVVFLRTLLVSVRQLFPQFGSTLDPIVHAPVLNSYPLKVHHMHAIIDALCRAFATEISAPFALILSNYEEINESAMLTDLVNALLQKLPPLLTLIIESRVVPDLSFTSFVIQDAMGGLDREALRFSAQEIADLVRLQGLPPLTDAEAEYLATSFDGWIAGILLGTRVGEARLRRLPLLHSSQNEQRVSLQERSFEDLHRMMLFTYVVDSVLKQQDPRTVSFLQTISVLQQIEPAICNALCECSDAAERLAYLERQGLFLTSHESATGITYSCHPVIREVFSEQLRTRDPARFLAVHRRATALWRASHNDEQAMYHALAGGAFDVAASLILEAAERLLQQGQYETIARWLAALPAEIQENHPRLLLLQTTLTLHRGQQVVAMSLLDRAEVLLSESEETDVPTLTAMLAILRSKALFQAGAYIADIGKRTTGERSIAQDGAVISR